MFKFKIGVSEFMQSIGGFARYLRDLELSVQVQMSSSKSRHSESEEMHDFQDTRKSCISSALVRDLCDSTNFFHSVPEFLNAL